MFDRRRHRERQWLAPGDAGVVFVPACAARRIGKVTVGTTEGRRIDGFLA
jgi:hypothetical protein